MQSLVKIIARNSYLLLINRYVIKDRCNEFTNAQRSQIVWQILIRAGYDPCIAEKVTPSIVEMPKKNQNATTATMKLASNFKFANHRFNQTGVARLLKKQVYTAAYPLHDGETSYNDFPKDDPRITWNVRRVSIKLYKNIDLYVITNYFNGD